MNVDTVYINTYRYDFNLARVCLASVRYWYPKIKIVLIKDKSRGNFDTTDVEKIFSVEVFETRIKKFGWGYGKLEPLFLEERKCFLMLDADTVITGPVIDLVKDIEADFVVDEEVQPATRFNEIYYNLERIHEVVPDFIYPGYSFNSGQWFGTSGLFKRSDFDVSLNWTNPPVPKFPNIIFNGDQAHINFLLHLKEQTGKILVSRKRLMVWPTEKNADFLSLEAIKCKDPHQPFIIHWAGMKAKRKSLLPRFDIIQFYEQYYYSFSQDLQKWKDQLLDRYVKAEKYFMNFRMMGRIG
jgi:hypothetical protein